MMDEPFIITVNYKGKDRDFEATLKIVGYTHRFHVDVDGVEVFFERDEENHYRAILPFDQLEKAPRNMDVGLLESIATAIGTILA